MAYDIYLYIETYCKNKNTIIAYLRVQILEKTAVRSRISSNLILASCVWYLDRAYCGFLYGFMRGIQSVYDKI